MKLSNKRQKMLGISLCVGGALAMAVYMIYEVTFGSGFTHMFRVLLPILAVTIVVIALPVIWFKWRPRRLSSRSEEIVPTITTVDLNDDDTWANTSWNDQIATATIPLQEEVAPLLTDHDVNIDKKIMSGEIPSRSTRLHWITMTVPMLMFCSTITVWLMVSFFRSPEVRYQMIALYSTLLSAIVAFLWWRHRGWYGRMKEYIRSNLFLIVGIVLVVVVVPALIVMIFTNSNLDWVVTVGAWAGERIVDLVRFLTSSLAAAMLPLVLVAVVNLLLGVHKWRTNKIYSATDYIMRVEGVFAKDSPVMKRDMVSDIVPVEYFDFMGIRLPFVKVSLESLGQDQGFRELKWVPREFMEFL